MNAEVVVGLLVALANLLAAIVEALLGHGVLAALFLGLATLTLVVAFSLR